MVDIHQQGQVDAACRQSRIVHGAQHGFIIRKLALGHVMAQPVEHAGLNIDGVDFARWSDAFGQTPREISHAGADIRHHRPLGYADGVQRSVRGLLGYALGPNQPWRSAHAHDLGGLSPGDRMCVLAPNQGFETAQADKQGAQHDSRLHGNHTFRAIGITAYLKNKGTLEAAQHIANHESPRTTKLYDRRQDEISVGGTSSTAAATFSRNDGRPAHYLYNLVAN